MTDPIVKEGLLGLVDVLRKLTDLVDTMNRRLYAVEAETIKQRKAQFKASHTETKLQPGDPHLSVCKNPAHCTGNCYEI